MHKVCEEKCAILCEKKIRCFEITFRKKWKKNWQIQLFYVIILFVDSDKMLKQADMAQSVERRLGKAEVTGSIPVISFYEPWFHFQGFFNI